jgi:hypothetical protein
MTTTEKIITVALVCLTLAFGAYVLTRPSGQTFGGVSNYNPLPSTFVTDSAVNCTTSSTLLLATSSASRPFLYVSNDSANAVFLGMNSSGVAKIYSGLMIPASTTIQLSSSYLGAIYCIGLGTPATTSISYIN